MQYLRLSLIATLALAGCAADDETSNESFPQTSGSFVGRYDVPTVSPSLATAATFPVDEVEWTITGSAVTLHYDLPLGLVGGKVDVTLTGAFAADASTLELAGAEGTGACTVTATAITCQEQLPNLGTLPVDIAVVEQIAARDYAGPVGDRITVATMFASEPIGVVVFDLTTPSLDDHGRDD